MQTRPEVTKQPRPELAWLLGPAIAVGCLGGGCALFVEPLRPAGALVLTAMFSVWMGWAARGAGRRRMAVTGVLVFASLTGIEMVAFLPDLRRAGLGLLLAVLCACVALLARSASPARRVGVISVGILGSAGVITVVDVRTALAGTLLLLLAAGVTIHLILGRWVRRHTGPQRWAAAAGALAAAVLIPAGVLGLIANNVRDGGAYAKRYGTLMTVDVGSPCSYTVHTRHGIPTGRTNKPLDCPALWKVGGDYESGRILGAWDDLSPGRRDQPAYVLGDRAWHPNLTRDNGLTLLGYMLPRWLIAGLVLGLATGLPIIVISRQSPL